MKIVIKGHITAGTVKDFRPGKIVFSSEDSEHTVCITGGGIRSLQENSEWNTVWSTAKAEHDSAELPDFYSIMAALRSEQLYLSHIDAQFQSASSNAAVHVDGIKVVDQLVPYTVNGLYYGRDLKISGR